jgi:hypothetical protein
VIDAALIQKCSDHALSTAIVEKFLDAVGTDDPLAVTVRADGRMILIPKPKTADEAMAIVRDYVGNAAVRVGVTQIPAGIGVSNVEDLKPDLVDACANLRIGTAMLAKVARIVTKWYGRPTNKELLPQMLDDTFYAWKTSNFEGVNVFRAEDPGGPTFFQGDLVTPTVTPEAVEAAPDIEARGIEAEPAEHMNPAFGNMRIDLSRIGGQK